MSCRMLPFPESLRCTRSELDISINMKEGLVMKTLYFSLVVLLVMTGCAARQVARPEIALVDLQVGEVTLLETGLRAIVRVDNEGQNPLRINGAVYRLYLNDIDVGRGMSSESITVPRLGSANQEVFFRINNIGLISRIHSLVESDQLSYKIGGHVYLDRGFGPDRRVAVERSDRLDMYRRIP